MDRRSRRRAQGSLHTANAAVRRNIVHAAAALACACAVGSSCSPPEHAPPALETGRLGRVHLQRPQGTPRGLVYLFSGAQGWGAQEAAAAAALRDRGAIVVGVDLAAYRAALDEHGGECLYLHVEIEALARQLEREAGTQRPLTPILAGLGEGATLAIAAVAQAPPAAVAGAVAVDPIPALRTRLPVCAGATAHRSDKGYIYTSAGPLPGFVLLGFTRAADAEGHEHFASEQSSAAGLRIARDETETRQPVSAPAMLADLASRYLAPSVAQQDVGERSRHLVELRSHVPGAPVVIVFSGDRGWRDPARAMAQALNDRGWNVLGWDSRRYFEEQKSPEGFAADLDAAVRNYVAAWNAPSAALVGLGFGADVLPFAYNRLSGESRDRIRQISLVGLSDTTDFALGAGNWFGAASGSERSIAAELARLPQDRVQCFYGEDDERTACPGLEATGVEVVRRAEGSGLDDDFDATVGKVVAGLARRGARLPEATPEVPAASAVGSGNGSS